MGKNLKIFLGSFAFNLASRKYFSFATSFEREEKGKNWEGLATRF